MKRVITAIILIASVALVAPQRQALAAPAATDPVWRVEVMFTTADIENAGTTDTGVRVALKRCTWVDIAIGECHSNETWVDYGRDDYERGDRFRYDLNLTGISRFSDIRMVEVANISRNDWCLQSFNLFVNGRIVFNKSFDNVSTTRVECLWLRAGNAPQVVASSDELRNHFYWRLYTQPTLNALDVSTDALDNGVIRISRAEVVSRLEGFVGDFIHRLNDDPTLPDRLKNLRWGCLSGPAVEVSRFNISTYNVHLDLKVTIDRAIDDDVCLDLAFQLRISCSAGRIALTLINTDLTFADGRPLTDRGLADHVDMIESDLDGTLIAFRLPAPVCPLITITPGGDLALGGPF